MSDEWYVYIVECKDGELYVGVTKDVQRRINQHNKGLGCRYTKYRRPVKLVFQEEQKSYSLARRREKEIKGFTRFKKFILIKNFRRKVLTPS